MITLKVNGQTHQFDGDPDMPLLWLLRDELNLKGTKFGCGAGLCGACTVHINGEAMRSCTTKASAAACRAIELSSASRVENAAGTADRGAFPEDGQCADRAGRARVAAYSSSSLQRDLHGYRRTHSYITVREKRIPLCVN